MAHNSTTRWEAPTFSFNVDNQPAAWREFYIRALDYLETLDIDPEQEDQHKKGWKQIKMMFSREDRQALQTMIDNNTITQADQCTPVQALKAIQTSIKDEEHYWHYRDEVLSDIRQQPEEQVHALNNRITTLINNCSFQDPQTTETIKSCSYMPSDITKPATGSDYRTQQHSPTNHSYNTASHSNKDANNSKKLNKREEQN